MIRTMGRILARAMDVTQLAAAFLVVAMMLHVTIDVLARNAVGSGFPATVEIVSNYYMVAIAFLPLALAEKMNAHISVEVVTQLLSQRLQNVAQYIAWLLSIFVYSILAYRTFLDAEEKREIGAFLFTQGVKLEIWPSYYFLPIGFALMALVLVYRCIVFFAPESDGLGFQHREGTAE